jgi:transposase-like protein
MDETYIPVKGEWRYLYRAVDKHGQSIDFCSPSSATSKRPNGF